MKFQKNKQKNIFFNYLQSKKQPPLTNRETANYSKIAEIYQFIYEDYFPAILTYKTKEFFF